MSRFPDYYKLLGLTKTATQDEIRTAYKKESLRTHPDRVVNASSAEKKKATERFQAVADAYYVLSDPTRRREYDALYSTRARERTDDPGSSNAFFSQFASMFGGASALERCSDAEPHSDDMKQQLLRPEVQRRAPCGFGAICGAGLGFIIANFPGLMLGAVAGNRLGAVRDAKGKSVAAVFSDLGGNQKAEILRALALKVLGSASAL
ncbi:DnaJ domain-containing protein [Mycena amicta]|nr:DnaJ domain-containing protein [Mycena amicta]